MRFDPDIAEAGTRIGHLDTWYDEECGSACLVGYEVEAHDGNRRFWLRPDRSYAVARDEEGDVIATDDTGLRFKILRNGAQVQILPTTRGDRALDAASSYEIRPDLNAGKRTHRWELWLHRAEG